MPQVADYKKHLRHFFYTNFYFMSRPVKGTYPPYFDNYISLVKEDDLFEAFKNQQNIVTDYFDKIPESKTNTGYAEGKWSLKVLLLHIIDTERIFNYRALCFARKETASLPGFDENLYAENSNGDSRTWTSLCEEFKAVRRSTELLYEGFNAEILNHSGIANNKPNTVIAVGFTTVGHVYHHLKIIEERYM